MSLAKSNLVLLVVFVALLVPSVLQLRREAEVFTDISRIPLLFDGFTPDNVGQVLLARPKAEQPAPDPQQPDQKPKVAYDQLLLMRSDKGWQLGATAGDRTGVPVLKDRVERDVFAHLQAISADRETLVQPNAAPDQLVNYGLDDEHAFVVKVVDKTGQQIIAELLVGRDAGQGQTGTDAVRGVFVRKSNSTDVILYEPPNPWRRDVDEVQWIDRVLAKLEPEKVRRLSLRNTASGAKAIVFTRESGQASWQAVEPPADVGAVRQTEVEALLQRLRYLSAQDFRLPLARVGNLQQLGLEPPAIELELTVAEETGERVLKLAVGGKVDGTNEYYLTCSEVPFLMTWPVGTATPFELDAKAQLFDPPAPQPTDLDKPQDGNR